MTDAIPTEALGRARDFMRRAEAEYAQYDRTAAQLLRPIRARVDRYPNRNLRPGLITSLVRNWHTLLPQHFRLRLAVTRPKPTRLEIIEIRVAPTTLRNDNWLNEDGETNLGVVNTVVALGMKGQRFLSQSVTHLFSRHALARRYQRCTEWDDAAVLRDIACLMAVQSDKKLDHAPCTIATERGEWRWDASGHDR